jgi:hypothetical protein
VTRGTTPFRISFFTVVVHATGLSARMRRYTPIVPAGMSDAEYVQWFKAEKLRNEGLTPRFTLAEHTPEYRLRLLRRLPNYQVERVSSPFIAAALARSSIGTLIAVKREPQTR